MHILPHHFFGHGDGHRRIASDFLAIGYGAVRKFAFRSQLIDEAGSQCLIRVDPSAGQHPVKGMCRADNFW